MLYVYYLLAEATDGWTNVHTHNVSNANLIIVIGLVNVIYIDTG